MKTRILNIIYIEPRDIFYPGVLLRTAYSALGKSLNKFILISKRRINMGDLARYSRIPVPRFSEIVRICNEYVNINIQPDIVISSQARPDTSKIGDITKLKDKGELTVLIDETGTYDNNIPIYFRTGLFNNLAYEAVSLLYILYIRDRSTFSKRVSTVQNVDYGELIYFMRNIASSITYIDNYPMIDPRTVVYTLRHVFRNHRMFIDISDSDIRIDYSTNSISERIKIDIYRYKDLQYIRSEYILFDGSILDTVFIDKNGDIIRIEFNIDPDKRTICVGDNLCISATEEKISEELLSLLF